MTRRLFVVVAVLVSSGVSILGQAKPSIQGVWRVVEVTITAPNPAPGGFSKGVHADVQPGIVIFTARHYSMVLDSAAKPRPATPFKTATRPTAEEAIAQWGPFQANSGTYELAGNVVTRHALVGKNPSVQEPKNFSKYTVKLEGNNLWMTLTENSTGKVANPVTVKYARVE